jgi:hypothetical protein
MAANNWFERERDAALQQQVAHKLDGVRQLYTTAADNRIAAYHEAGHAVIVARYRRAVKSVCLVNRWVELGGRRDDKIAKALKTGWLGFTNYSLAKNLAKDAALPEVRDAAIAIDIIVHAAGLNAERAFFGEPASFGNEGDLKLIAQDAKRIGASFDDVKKLIGLSYGLVCESRGAVDAVAQALLAKGRLSDSEVAMALTDAGIKQLRAMAIDQFSPSPTSPSGMMRGDFGARVQSSKHGSNVDQSMPMPIGQDPPESEAQRRAMWAAAEGNSTLGIPKSVGKEFVESDQNFAGAGPGNPPPVGPDQHRQFTDDLSDGHAPSDLYSDVMGRARDGLEDQHTDLLRPKQGTHDSYEELQQGMPTQRDAAVLAAIRQYLKSCNYSDADRAEVIHYFLNDRNPAEPEAQDDQIGGGPPKFKGMPERGGTMADQNVMTGNSGSVIGYAGDSGGEFSPPDDFDKLYPKAFAIDASRGAFDQQYEYERLKALSDVKHEREANLQLAQDTAIAYGHFLSRLADRRPRALDFNQTKRLATAMAKQQARSNREYAQPLALDQTFMPEAYDANALRYSAQLAATEQEFEEFLSLRPSKH